MLEIPLAILVAVVSSVATAFLIRLQGIAAEVATHDRLRRYATEDLNRWVSDRQAAASVRMLEILQQANAAGVTQGGALAQAAGKVFKHVLHEYRDRGNTALREVEELADREGRLHRWRRARTGRALEAPVLSSDALELLTDWRTKAEEDVSRFELEPQLAVLERGGGSDG